MDSELRLRPSVKFGNERHAVGSNLRGLPQLCSCGCNLEAVGVGVSHSVRPCAGALERQTSPATFLTELALPGLGYLVQHKQDERF